MENNLINTSDSVPDIGQRENLSHEKTSKKSFLLILGVIFLLVAGAVVYGFSLTPTPVKHTDNWLLYTNDVYGYSIRYPRGWEIREAKKRIGNNTAWEGDILLPQDNELQKVNFVQMPFKTFGGAFEVKVLGNPKHVTLDEWVGALKYPLTANPTINLAQKKGQTTLGKEKAEIIEINTLNYPENLVVVAQHSGNIYFLQYAEIDPQFPNEQDMLVYKKDAAQILSSFTFTK